MLKGADLSCERQQRVLFDGISFEVKAGEVMYIEGPNGSGKTTLLRILCGLYVDFEGEVEWELDRFPVYLGHRTGVKDHLTAEENLAWLARLYEGVEASPEDVRDALAEVGLRGFEDVRCGSLSEGQRKRVNIARLYLLDSPAWVSRSAPSTPRASKNWDAASNGSAAREESSCSRVTRRLIWHVR
jgi:heme exporter protein A